MPNRKENYRDMQRYHITRRQQIARWRKRGGSGKYPKRPWTDEEIKLVMAHQITDRELSHLIQRSVVAIQTKRFHLKNNRL